MLLVDTSVWADHLRYTHPSFEVALAADSIACHPFVIGELAMGSLPNRARFLEFLANLPSIEVATHDEVMMFVTQHRLYSRGLSYIDVSLLAGASLSDMPFFTLDKRLAKAATEVGVQVAQAVTD